jgi:hypothetical protein
MSYFVRSQEYTNSLPEVVPVDGHMLSSRPPAAQQLPLYMGTLDADAAVSEQLRQITQQPHTYYYMEDWRDYQRSQIQQILPFMCSGPSASKKKEFVKEHGITLLLSVRDMVYAKAGFLSGKKLADECGIQSETIDVADIQQLMSQVFQVITIINNHLLTVFRTTGGRGGVLVYCETGNERSALVAACYLVAMYDVSARQAVRLIASQRFSIDIESRSLKQLEAFKDITDARRSVLNNTVGPTPGSAKRSRRTEDEQEESNDWGKHGRHVAAPFVDGHPANFEMQWEHM